MKLTKHIIRKLIKTEINKTVFNEAQCQGNYYHSADGTWTNNDDAKSWSMKDRAGCYKGGQYKYRKKKLKDREPCGRKQPKELCKEEEILSDGSEIENIYASEKIEAVIRDTIKQELEALRNQQSKMSKGCSWSDVLNAMDKMERAEKGKLYAKQK